jgi:hypothetical protein
MLLLFRRRLFPVVAVFFFFSFFSLLFLPLFAAGANAYDVLVYDATSGGVAAAVSAARAGRTVALLCASWPACFAAGGMRIGGMSTSGLGQTDIGDTSPYLGGLASEFYRRNWQHYAERGRLRQTPASSSSSSACRLPSESCNRTYNLEPHLARQIFHEMIAEEGANITLFYEAQVASVSKDPASKRLLSLETVDGRTFVATVFIDASYEGDLMAKSGVAFRVGRESAAQYNESFAGTRASAASHQFKIPVDPFLRDPASGDILSALPHAQLPKNPMQPKGADARVQSYNFRLCTTRNASQRVPFPKPDGYESSEWELLRRYLEACSSEAGAAADDEEEEEEEEEDQQCQLGFPSCNTAQIPNGKFDMNNCGPFSSDFIGASWNYPEATYMERQAIWRKHMDYTQGLLYYMQSDPLSPPAVRRAMAPHGLCADEFQDNTLAPHFPPGLYVRAARRLVGEKVFTQNTPAVQRARGGISQTNESIGMGGYNFDSHNARRLACKNVDECYGRANAPPGLSPPSGSFTWNEGDIETNPGLYQIPYWVLLPKASDATNLLLVGAPSASHIGMSTLRMEPQYMIIGGAAGVAASLFVEKAAGGGGGSGGGSVAAAVQDIDRATLTERLRAMGQILSVKHDI